LSRSSAIALSRTPAPVSTSQSFSTIRACSAMATQRSANTSSTTANRACATVSW
jgi:hypothetical protein